MNQEKFTQLTREIAKSRTSLLIIEDIIETIMLEKSDVYSDLLKIQSGTYKRKQNLSEMTNYQQREKINYGYFKRV